MENRRFLLLFYYAQGPPRNGTKNRPNAIGIEGGSSVLRRSVPFS